MTAALVVAYAVVLAFGLGDTARWLRTGDPIAAADALVEMPFAGFVALVLVAGQ